MKFNELDITQSLIEKTNEQGFRELTQIQEKCLPEILNGKDIIGQAETGSGKTLAFCLPILDKIKVGYGIQAIVITPTRELCTQVKDEFVKFGKNKRIKTISIHGGVNIDPQIKNLKKADVVIGTPGRLIDHINRGTIDCDNVEFFVLDEMDKMLDMGFIDDVEIIISHIPKKRQTLMFSATISGEIHELIKKHSHDAIIIKTQSFVDSSKLKQVYFDIMEKNNKFSILVHLLRRNKKGLSIVFCATRNEADVLEKNLRKLDMKVSVIHGGMKQSRRMKNLEALKKQQVKVLVATDVAARGLDIKNVSYIYNYDVPKTSKDYTHRIGRTARAGKKGMAFTLLTKQDHDNFRRVQREDEHEIHEMKVPEFKKIPFTRRFEKNQKTLAKSIKKPYKGTYKKQGSRQGNGRKRNYSSRKNYRSHRR